MYAYNNKVCSCLDPRTLGVLSKLVCLVEIERGPLVSEIIVRGNLVWKCKSLFFRLRQLNQLMIDGFRT